MLYDSNRVQKGEESGRSLYSSDWPMVAFSGYKYSVETSIVTNSKASRRFFVFRGRGFDPGPLQPFG